MKVCSFNEDTERDGNPKTQGHANMKDVAKLLIQAPVSCAMSEKKWERVVWYSYEGQYP